MDLFDDPELLANYQNLRKTFPNLPEHYGPEALRAIQILEKAAKKIEAHLIERDVTSASIEMSLANIKINAPWLFSKEG